MAPRRSAPVELDLGRVLELLRTHITAALCRTVFATLRITERQRRWTLEALIQFWLAVILRAPRALSQALYETLEGSEPLFPLVQASPEAFFQRCQSLRPAFFAEVFARFTARLLQATPARYAQDLGPLQARFAAVCVVDGSRLAAIAHRLKLLWPERAVVLPGCLLAVYDLGHGLCRTLAFCADAAAGELTRALAAVGTLPRDTLVLADRLYGNGVWFAALAAQGCWGLVRRNRRLGLRKVRRLTRRTAQGGRLTDWVVEAGGSRTTPVQVLRYIRWQRGTTVRAVLTNVLDPTRLSAQEALALYPPAVEHRAALLRSQGSAEPSPGLRGQPERGGHAGLRRRVRLQRDAGSPRGSRRGRRAAPRGDLARQVLPQAGGGVSCLCALRAVVPGYQTSEPGPAAAQAIADAPPLCARPPGGDPGRAAERPAAETPLLCGAEALEVAGACARR